MANINLKTAHGCDACSHTGYKGRMAIVEYLRCDSDIRALPKDERFVINARQHSAAIGGRTLIEDGLLKAIKRSDHHR